MSITLKNIKVVLYSVIVVFSIQSWAGIQIIAETGQPADDFPEGYFFWDIDSANAAIGASGHIAFSGVADISIYPTDNNKNAIWSGLPGQLSVIIQENESANDFPSNILFEAGKTIIVSRSGHVGFLASLKGTTSKRFEQQGLFVHFNNTTSGIIRNGGAAPGFPPGTIIQQISDFSFSDAGMVISGFVTDTTSPSNVGIWFYNFTNSILLPPPIPNCNFVFPPITNINDSGEIVLIGALVDSNGNDCDPSLGVFKWQGTEWELLLAEEDSVPNMTNIHFSFTGSFLSFQFPSINDQGDIAFPATVKNSALIQKNGLWISDGKSEPKLLLLAEEILKNDPNNSVTDSIFTFSRTGFTNDEYAMIPVTITDETTVILAGTPKAVQPYSNLDETGESQLSIIAQQNMQPPGFEPTWYFSQFNGQAINRKKQYIFTANVKNSVTGNQVTAIWRGNHEIRPRLAAMPGMKTTVNDKQRILQQIIPLNQGMEGNVMNVTRTSTDGKAMRFSDNGDFLINGTLTDSFEALLLLKDDSREHKVFTLAEQFLPQFFAPANVNERLLEGFRYRFYPDTNTYIAIKNDEVFIWGDTFGSGLQQIGTIDSMLQLLENITAP